MMMLKRVVMVLSWFAVGCSENNERLRISPSSGHVYHYLENLEYIQRVARYQVRLCLFSGHLISVGSRVGTLLVC